MLETFFFEDRAIFEIWILNLTSKLELYKLDSFHQKKGL